MAFSQCGGTHAASLTCWLCSDARPWWREARVNAGLSAEPPNEHPNAVYGPEPEPVYEVTFACTDCGITVASREARCASCQRVRDAAEKRGKARATVRVA